LIDVEPVVRRVLESQAEHMASRDISPRIDAEPLTPPVLIAPEDLDMILANLISNAAKYNRVGGDVTVRTGQDGEWVRIDVEDTGIGIAQENMDQLFTDFFREKKPETRQLEGSGLGLSIVKRLAERAGGRVEVKSEEGRGSTFSVLLPA
jgi:signal transduction histidine kinase